MPIIEIANHGPLILSSTYWGSGYEAAGKIFCSPNAGSIRILVPRTRREIIAECRKVEYVILSRGPWPAMALAEGIEILFEDHSESPFSIQLTPESFALLPAKPPAEQEWILALWDLKKNRPHKAVERKCYWRRVPKIPWLKPWKGK